VLLALVALLRRADATAVIGTALALKAAGLGHRRIATRVGPPGGHGCGAGCAASLFGARRCGGCSRSWRPRWAPIPILSRRLGHCWPTPETAIQSPHAAQRSCGEARPWPAPKELRNRQRFDLAPAGGDQQSEVDWLVSLGATRLEVVRTAPSCWTIPTATSSA